eukprot:7379863-Prymnesium_polylepis.1
MSKFMLDRTGHAEDALQTVVRVLVVKVELDLLRLGNRLADPLRPEHDLRVVVVLRRHERAAVCAEERECQMRKRRVGAVDLDERDE